MLEFARSASWLTTAVVLALPVSVQWGNKFAGETGEVAGASAAGLCWIASLLALVVRIQFPKPQEVVVGTLGAMLVRMVMIFGGGLLVASTSPQLVKAAFWGQVISFFMLTLTLETLLAVRWVKRLEASESSNSSKQSSLSSNGAKAV